MKSKSQINSTKKFDKLTQDEKALFHAIHNGKTTIVRNLIEAGVNVNAEYDSITPLVIAIHTNNLGIIELLLENKANPNIKLPGVKKSKLPLLIDALQRNMSYEITEILLKYNTNINEPVEYYIEKELIRHTTLDYVFQTICCWLDSPEESQKLSEKYNYIEVLNVLILLVRHGAKSINEL